MIESDKYAISITTNNLVWVNVKLKLMDVKLANGIKIKYAFYAKEDIIYMKINAS